MDSDDYSEANPSQPSRRMPRRAAKLKEPARLTRSAAAYKSQGSASDPQGSPDGMDQSSDESDSATEEDEEEDFSVARHGRKRRPSQLLTAASKRPRRTKPSKKPTRPPITPPRPKNSRNSLGKSSAKKALPASQDQRALVLAGDWQHLPYMIWENIFDFVAGPIGDPKARQEDITLATRTLRNATRASKVLVEPAVTARYRHVHLGNHSSARDLSTTLGIDPERTALQMRYRSKIETLRIDVGEILGRKVQGQYVTLWELIRNLPRLKDVELYHPLDMSYTRDDLEANVRWKYPDELLDTLAFVPDGNQVDNYSKQSPTELRSWTWSARLATESYSLERLAVIHQMPSFSSLQKLKFINYQVPSLGTKVGDEAALAMDLPEIQKLAAAICALPKLEHLMFKSSTMVNSTLLNLLPKNLKHLELHDCYDVTSDALRDFLLTHGRWMQRLTLDHCRGLSLGFLTVLRDACPNLTHLNMDLTYFRYIQSDPDNEPEYSILLRSDEVPAWPRTLQYLNIQNMRSWGPSLIESATAFFKSLTDSASALPDLRHIALRVKLDVLRRERYKFRDIWIPKMENIFQRRSGSPQPVPRRRLIVPIQTASSAKDPAPPTTPTRRSSRIAERPPTPTTDEVAKPSQREIAFVRRVRKETKRLASSSKGYHADIEDSEDELSAAGSGFMPATPIFKQRLCDVVDIVLDNQTISEHRFTEQDFLYSTADDDDDEYQE